MDKALNALLYGHTSIWRSALDYDIPKLTLGDWVSGRVLPGIVSGPPTYLTLQEEEELVVFLLRCSSIGYAKSCKEVIALVEQIIHSKAIHRPVSNG